MTGEGDGTVSGEMERVERAAAAVRERWDGSPRALLILGTGLDALAEDVEVRAELPCAEIPGFPEPTMELQEGRLLLGRLEGVPVAAMRGRFHRYEGHSLKDVTLPVRTGRALGAEVLVTSGACGCMNPRWEAGDLVLISDHINLMGDNPLVGENVGEQGPRFPDMSDAYDAELRRRLRSLAVEQGQVLREGVYVAVTGPNLETAAEYRMLRRMGADVVGMSTVPEVIVANHCGMRVAGLAVITDMALPDALEPVDIDEIMGHAAAAGPGLRRLVRSMVAGLEEDRAATGPAPAGGGETGRDG